MKDIEKLLPGFCEGELGHEEEEKVLAWLGENPEHRNILRNIAGLCVDYDALDIIQGVDTDAAFAKVRRRIKNNRLRRFAVGLQRVAAFPHDAASDGAPVQMMEFRTNPGMTGSVVLPDGTSVILNSRSVLRYPSSFQNGPVRKVEFEGEAFFDVAKNERVPFEISLSSGESVRVYGTEFNLEAYPGKNIITTLVSGSVGFVYSGSEGDAEEARIAPLQRLEYNPATGLLSFQQTGCESETAWKDGKMLLDRTSMGEILKILSKRYDLDKGVENLTFSGGYVTMNRLEQLLDSFSISSSMHWRYVPSVDIRQKQKIEIY